MAYPLGLDVSQYQGKIPWGEWKKQWPLQFVAVRAQSHRDGDLYTDTQFKRNWRNTKDLYRIAYCYPRVAGDPQHQASRFLKAVGNLRDTDRLCLDMEDGKNEPADEVAAFGREFCRVIERETGKQPIVYTYPWFAESGRCDGLGKYPLWLADLSGGPSPPSPWNTWSIWQFTFEFEGNHLDADRFNNEKHSFAEFFGGFGPYQKGHDLGDRTLSLWDAGDDVKQLQRILNGS